MPVISFCPEEFRVFFPPTVVEKAGVACLACSPATSFSPAVPLQLSDPATAYEFLRST